MHSGELKWGTLSAGVLLDFTIKTVYSSMILSDQWYDFAIAYWNLAVHYPFSEVIQWREGTTLYFISSLHLEGWRMRVE